MTAVQATRAKWVSREARQREILAAAADSIARVGFADTTLATVARAAGMSPASLVFHFKTKDALLTATLRHLAEEFTDTWKAALAAAPDEPLARLMALVAASFAPGVCNRKSVAAWHAFYGEAKARPDYLKICGAFDHERHEALKGACAAVLAADGEPTDPAGELAVMIDAFADGLWTDLLFGAGSTSRTSALRLALAHLRFLLPRHAGDIAALEARA